MTALKVEFPFLILLGGFVKMQFEFFSLDHSTLMKKINVFGIRSTKIDKNPPRVIVHIIVVPVPIGTIGAGGKKRGNRFREFCVLMYS